MTTYFNILREHDIKVYPEDTLWIDIFARYVIDNKLMPREKLVAALDRTIEVLSKNQSSKDVVALLKKFDIDYKPIDEYYETRLQEYKEIFKK